MPFTKRKLNITHINTQDMPGGASKSTMRLAEMQRRDGHHVSVLVGRKNADFEHYFSFPLGVDPNLQAHCRQAGQLYYEFQGSYQLLYHPLIQDADIVHFHNLHGGYFNPYSISALSHFKPVVWTLRDMQSITGQCAHSIDCNRWKTGCGRCPYLFVYPRLSIDNTAQLWRDKKLVYEHSHLWIVAISRWMMDKIKESILKDHPAAQIYNLSDPSVFKPSNKKEARKRYGIPENKFVIGAAANGGTLNNLWKGGAYSLAAIEILTSKHPEIVFVNIGTSLESTNSKIINIPHLNREKDMAEVYATLDLFLYTPRAETFSLVVLEALSCGIPVVTFKTGGVPEILRHGTDGYVVEFQDIWGLVRHVELLISDPKLHAQFCLNARERAILKFDQDNIYKKYMNYYERCIKEHPLKSRTLKSFPIDMVPDIIKTRAFLNSEKFKSTLKEKKPFLREGLKAEQAIRPEPRTENKYVPIGFGNKHTDKRLDGRFLIIENLFSERKAMQIERNAQADIAIINEEGESLFKKGNFAGALNAFTQALEIDPNTAVTHNNLGVLYYNQGDKEKSFKHYELASILAPENIIYQKNLADFNFIELGRTKEALEIYLKILKDNPTDLETLLILGHICGSLNKFDDAKVFYNKVLEIEPWNMDARERLDGLGKGLDDSLIGGLDDWEKGRDGVQGRGMDDSLIGKSDDWEKGREVVQGKGVDDSLIGGFDDWEKGRDGVQREGIDDSLIRGFDDWGRDGGQGEKIDGSLIGGFDDWEKGREGVQGEKIDDSLIGGFDDSGRNVGGTTEKMYQDAQELTKSGREKDGIDALESLLKAYPDFGLAHNDLGVLYYNDGDKEKALKHYEQAAELEPDNSIFKKNLADFYYVELGEIEKSLLIYLTFRG